MSEEVEHSSDIDKIAASFIEDVFNDLIQRSNLNRKSLEFIRVHRKYKDNCVKLKNVRAVNSLQNKNRRECKSNGSVKRKDLRHPLSKNKSEINLPGRTTKSKMSINDRYANPDILLNNKEELQKILLLQKESLKYKNNIKNRMRDRELFYKEMYSKKQEQIEYAKKIRLIKQKIELLKAKEKNIENDIDLINQRNSEKLRRQKYRLNYIEKKETALKLKKDAVREKKENERKNLMENIDSLKETKRRRFKELVELRTKNKEKALINNKRSLEQAKLKVYYIKSKYGNNVVNSERNISVSSGAFKKTLENNSCKKNKVKSSSNMNRIKDIKMTQSVKKRKIPYNLEELCINDEEKNELKYNENKVKDIKNKYKELELKEKSLIEKLNKIKREKEHILNNGLLKKRSDVKCLVECGNDDNVEERTEGTDVDKKETDENNVEEQKVE